MINRISAPWDGEHLSEENKCTGAWLEVEILADEAWAELGEIPKEDGLWFCEKADFGHFRDWAGDAPRCGGFHTCGFWKRLAKSASGSTMVWLLPTWWILPYGYLYKQANDYPSHLKTSPTSSLIRLWAQVHFSSWWGAPTCARWNSTTFGPRLWLWYSEEAQYRAFRATQLLAEAGKISRG